MDYITEYAKEIVDRFLKSKGWDPGHVDRNRRMAMTKTKEFQFYAQRMSGMVGEEGTNEAMEFPQGDFDAKGTSAKVVGEKKLSKPAQIVKSIYKKGRIKEELYDHEKDDKDGTTYGKKPKLSSNKQETDQQGQGDKKTQAAAVLSGGKTLTGQNRDTVEIDPVLKKSKPGSPNGEVGNPKQ